MGGVSAVPELAEWDVAILGSGLAGSTLGAILARQGFRVLLLESGVHPRFAVGESVVPEFGALARILAGLYDLPELARIANFQELHHHVSANSGVKRNFSFVHHRPGQEPTRADWVQFHAMTPPLGPDSHIYRPDLDAWLTALAIEKGADYREKTPVDDVLLDPTGVTVVSGARRFRARFVADASGHGSVLAKKLGLKREPTLATNSRTLFTHMVGVREVAACVPGGPPLPSPPDQGTLHHYFDGGWFWVIPFGNHSRARNPVTSVGLTLDRTRHPDTALDPEAEFRHWAEKFPLVQRQLGGARAVRSWVKTGRLQYQCAPTSGDRWCLLAHSAGFIDALFSSGMSLTFISVRDLAAALIPALRQDDLRRERFQHLEENARENMAMLDKVVHGAFLAMRSGALWNAWYRIWAVANFHGSTALVRLHMQHAATGQRRFLEQSQEAPWRRSLATEQPWVKALIDEGYLHMQALQRGQRGEAETVDAIFALLARQDWIPPRFQVARREHRHLAPFTVFPLMMTILWGKRRAPREVRALLYDVGPVFFWLLTRALAREWWRGLLGWLRFARAAHWTRGRM